MLEELRRADRFDADITPAVVLYKSLPKRQKKIATYAAYAGLQNLNLVDQVLQRADSTRLDTRQAAALLDAWKRRCQGHMERGAEVEALFGALPEKTRGAVAFSTVSLASRLLNGDPVPCRTRSEWETFAEGDPEVFNAYLDQLMREGRRACSWGIPS